jgi:hypothetical protein
MNQRRADFNKDCPSCGSGNVRPWGKTLYCYKCLECGWQYMIDPNQCRACGTWISDDAEYCEWHASHGHSDGNDDEFVSGALCIRCGKNPIYSVFDLCKSCMDAEYGGAQNDWVAYGNPDEHLNE